MRTRIVRYKTFWVLVLILVLAALYVLVRWDILHAKRRAEVETTTGPAPPRTHVQPER